jgi:uncharacterized membrane protein (UPF0127 family)
MSFMSKKYISIGLLLLVIVFGCLLYVRYHSLAMSFRENRSTIAPSASSVATSTALIVATSTALGNASTTSMIHYEIVTTSAAQQRGLGGRAVIPDNYAMLFVFPDNSTPGFWMKDMLAPIDMIWVTSSGTIAAINDSVPVSSYPGVLYPPYPIRYVLETRAGFARAQGWHVGTTITLPSPY